MTETSTRPIPKSARYLSLDILKAWSIFGVVAIHVFVLVEDRWWAGAIMSYFRFAVPVFIFTAFYISCKRLGKRALGPADFARRMFRLAVPYFAFSVLYHFYFHGDKGWTPVQIVQRNILGVAWQGQYFLVLMFQLTLLLFAFQRILGKLSLRVAILTSAAIFVVCFIPLSYMQFVPFVAKVSLGLFVFYMPYFLVACGLGNASAKNTKAGLGWIAGLLFLAPVLIVIESFFVPVEPYTYTSVTCVISSLLVACVLVTGEKKLANAAPTKWQAAIRAVSEHTLGIFCLNPLIISLSYRYIFYDLQHSGVSPALFLPIQLVFVFAICFLTSYLLGKVKWLNSLFR